MKKVIAKVDFQAVISGKLYSHIKGDEITGLKYEQIVKLNEMGLIEPLDFKDLVIIKREIENPTKDKKTKEE
jgi:hypothetical protein